MQPLYHELSVLAKAVHFKNLSAAALHVGLSQPQLSRIIARLEDEMKVILLDRSARRKSGWTPTALQIARIFEESHSRMETEIYSIVRREMIDELNVGTLEGLSHVALKTCKACFERMGLKKISLNIYDLSELEANFLSGDLDLIFTSKHPGRQKFKNHEVLGYQEFAKIRSNPRYGVYSTFEYTRASKKDAQDFPHVFISNSLALKREWFREIGGVGSLPSEPRRQKTSESEVILLIGSELLSPPLWSQIRQAAIV